MSALTDKARNTAVATKNQTLADLIEKQRGEINKQLAGAMNTDAFIRAAISQTKATPLLQKATPASFLGSIMLAAQLHLEIGPALGQFHLTPRTMNRGKEDERVECVPIIGYQGYVELGYRSNRVRDIDAFLVRSGDHFDYGADHERGHFFEWKPADVEEDRNWTHVVAIARLTTGGTAWARLTKAQVLARRPKFWDSGPWKSHEESMALKTGFRALAPKMPKSLELGKALEADEKTVSVVPGDDELVIEGETVGEGE